VAEIEAEVKLTISPEDYHRILASGDLLGCREQLNVYFHDPRRLREGSGFFRVRFETGSPPVATLKIPVDWEGGVRRMVEMEEPLEAMGPGLYPRPRRRVDVEDLSGEMARHFLAMGVTALVRLGWMRNRRCLVGLGREGVVEVDRTLLPDRTVQYEVEIETSDPGTRKALVERVRDLAPSAAPSSLGKFSRFLEAMGA